MAPRRPPGIRGLAEALGLSTYTVSRALSGHADVAEATRERVRAKAREIGYTPHLGGRMLRSGRSDAVGFVLNRTANGFLDPYFLPVLNGLEAELTAAGLDLIVTSAPEGEAELPVFRRLVEGRRVDALVFSRVRPADARVAYLSERDFPFTTLGRDGVAPAHPFVDVDHARSGRMAAEWLLAQGHRRIALVNTPERVNASQQRHRGFLAAHEQAGLAHDPLLLREGDYGIAPGRAAMDTLLRLPRPPTAVVCGTDELAFGAAEAIAAAGLRVGADVALIGCDDLPMAAMAVPPLATFRTSVRLFGEKLGRQVRTLLAGEVPASELLVPEWVPRASAGGPPEREPTGH